jgi:hypothetical protein
MSQRDVEKNWTRDRAALIECKARHRELKRYYIDRDARLR